MAIKTDLNVAPYFDDYDEAKNFHRVLFRPATAVQARELTQLQSILQNQIERFGNWAFKNGDIVYGCSIVDIPVLPYVRLDDYASNGDSFSSANLSFTRVVSQSSNLQARVFLSKNGLAKDYPNTNVVYLQYINTGINGETHFSNTDQLNFYKIPLTGNNSVDNVATINVYSNSVANQVVTGNAHAISVSDGVVFLNGNFVRVPDATYGLVNNFGTYAANNLVGFQAVETIVTENVDETILDNALGYYNENAPGAHRLKIVSELIALDPDTAASTNNFNAIATYSYGALATKNFSNTDIHSIINSAISTRVYEESGNFVVNPFSLDSVTATVDPNVYPSDSNHVLIKINPGIGYSAGNRVSIEKAAYIDIRRGIDTRVNKSQIITFNFGNYFKINEVAGTFDYSKADLIYFYDTPQQAVTNRLFTSLTPSGNIIGTARARCFSYNSGSSMGTNNSIYSLHVFDLNIYQGYSVNNIKSVYANGSSLAVADIQTPGLFGTSNKNQLFSFGVKGLKKLRDENDNNNTQYTYRAKANTSLRVDGSIVVTITGSQTGGTDQLPYGVSVLPASALTADISVVATANAVTANLTGNVSIANTTTTSVVGLSTTFSQDFSAGDIITVGSDNRTVVYVVNDTNMIVDAAFTSSTNAGGSGYYKKIYAGKQFAYNTNTSVTVTNSTSFTIQTNLIPSAPVNVTVDYNVLRTLTSPAKKVLRRNRYVKINTTANPNGPWCLGFSDIHKINAIYAGSTYSNSSVDIKSLFTFDNGQRDTHYGLGYLYAKSGQLLNNSSDFLVNLDYFVANTTPGIGFFTVESYPIDDANTANTTAIQTKDIPLFVDSSGNYIPLQDFVDFRPYANNTANDSITDSGSSVNPSSNLSFNYGSTGLNVPAFGKNLQADYTMYLPRSDLIYITPDNILKCKEGVSNLVPGTPLYPDNSLVLAVVNVPAYPSLSSDQVENSINLNASCLNVCRDVSNRITTSVLTNKRYTMNEIGKLENRITNLEYYTQLSLLQQQTKDLTVTDANGLDRFKNGIFVEPFSDFTLSDVSNPEFNMAIDFKRGVGRPKIFRDTAFLKFDNTNSNVQKTGNLITLPYVSVPYLTQPYATKYRSAARVAFGWVGTLLTFPSLIDQFNVHNAGTVNITVDQATPWQQFAASPFGYNWGGWETSTDVKTDVATDSVVSGEAKTYDTNIDLGLQTATTLGFTTLNLVGMVNSWIAGRPGTVLGKFINAGATDTPPAGSVDMSKASWNWGGDHVANPNALYAKTAGWVGDTSISNPYKPDGPPYTSTAS